MATAVKALKKPAISPREQGEELLARYAELSTKLDELKTARKPMEEEYVQLRERLQEWADNNPDESEATTLPSYKLTLGSIGYRQGVEKLDFVLEDALPEQERNAKIQEALKRYLPGAIKTGYDEKAIVKAWDVLPKLRNALQGIISGTKRESQFVISLKK